MKKKVRAAKARRARTENDFKELLTKLGTNPFGLDMSNPKSVRATKTMLRTLVRFKKDYNKTCEKYPHLTFDNLLDLLRKEVGL